MFVGAVTGTNGKTSTVEFARQLMSSNAHSAASLGTLGLTGPRGQTTEPQLVPGSGAIPTVIDDLVPQGVRSLFIEAYSSALQMQLLDETFVRAGAFTNLSSDHLDVHGSMDRYYRAKRRLFEDVVATGGTAVLNADTPQFNDLSARCYARGIDVISFGRSPTCDLRLVALHPELRASHRATADFSFFGRRFSAQLSFAAEFMAANALCAAGLAMSAGIDESAAADGLGQLTAPDGRMQWIADHAGAPVLVDYAHTPHALGAALRALRPFTPRRIVLVFGCGGDRDAGKRASMGEVAAAYADTVIVTDDNPRREPAADIRRAIIAAVPTAQDIPDRSEAIGYALGVLQPGDALLVAGKGHERFQIVPGGRRAFTDRLVIQERLRGLRIR